MILGILVLATGLEKKNVLFVPWMEENTTTFFFSFGKICLFLPSKSINDTLNILLWITPGDDAVTSGTRRDALAIRPNSSKISANDL